MIIVETNRTTPVYSNIKGREKAVKKEDRLFTESARSERKSGRETKRSEIKSIREKAKSGELTKKEARQLKRKARKVKRGAVKLQLTKRFTKDGKPLFVYRLQKVFKGKDGKWFKKLPDGSKVEVKPTDVINTQQGTYDANDIAKASGISVDAIKSNPSTVDSVTTTVTQSSSGSEIATETTTNSASADLAVEVPTENIVNTTTGEEGEDVSYETGDDLFLEEDTLTATNTEDTEGTEENKDKDENTDTKTKTPMKTWEKILLFGGIAVVLGLVTFAIVKRKK